MTCHKCNQEGEIQIIPYYYKNRIYLGHFKAEICNRCNEIYFDRETIKNIEKSAKLLNIWGKKAISEERELFSASVRRIPLKSPSIIFREQPIISPIYTCRTG